MTDSALPPRARELVASIERKLGEAVPLLLTGGDDQDAFALRETERRYLPDTLRAYHAVPPSQRDAAVGGGESAESALVASLETLDRAVALHLERLGAAARDRMRANRGFLAERFAGAADPAGVPAVPPAAIPPVTTTPALPGTEIESVSTAVLRTFFDDLATVARADDRALLERIADRFSQAFPRAVRVSRSLFKREATAVEISLPGRSGAISYSLAREPQGLVATVGRVVNGIRIKTETVAVDAWLQALGEHLAEYHAADRDAMNRLEAIFGA